MISFIVPAHNEEALIGRTLASIRGSLNVSQAVFAQMIGVSAGTVRAWEQGRNTPSTLARCLLAEVKRNRGYWKGRLRRADRNA